MIRYPSSLKSRQAVLFGRFGLRLFSRLHGSRFRHDDAVVPGIVDHVEDDLVDIEVAGEAACGGRGDLAPGRLRKVADDGDETSHHRFDEVADVLGVCSLIVWALTMVVTVKYLMFVMRADNQGEGGILALLALVPQKKHARIGLVTVMVVAGAALLYGDGIITPAISVLSAVEGLGAVTASSRPPSAS